MDGLFKLVFYIIIGIVWILSNTKKQALWKEDDPNFPPAKPKVNPLPKPKMDQPFQEAMFSEAAQPDREGTFFEPAQPAPFDQFKHSYYETKLEMKKKAVTRAKKN
ncbi:MAG: hypothetical protein KKD05_03795 [Candidatus Omnitrophica bacterium]|nr:hypothetical protein [Candidatus Omnitrophota bacterium]